MLYCRIPDVDDEGVWPLIKDLEDPDLVRLAERLPTTLLHSRAYSTTKKYTGAYRRWKAWAVFPSTATLHCTVQSIGDNLESVSAAEAAVL